MSYLAVRREKRTTSSVVPTEYMRGGLLVNGTRGKQTKVLGLLSFRFRFFTPFKALYWLQFWCH